MHNTAVRGSYKRRAKCEACTGLSCPNKCSERLERFFRHLFPLDVLPHFSTAHWNETVLFIKA